MKINSTMDRCDFWDLTVPDKIILKQMFDNILTFNILNEQQNLNIDKFLESNEKSTRNIIKSCIDRFENMKINFNLFVLYSKQNSSFNIEKQFHTRYFILNSSNNLDELILNISNDFKTQSYKCHGYELNFANVIKLDINMYKIFEMKGSSYIKLPSEISLKRAIVNVQNKDNACFAWAIVSAIHPSPTQPHRVSLYPNYKNVLNLDGVTFPMKFKDIPHFEKINNMSINVFGIDKNKKIVGPLHHCSERKRTHINLLYISEKNGNGHFCWIRNMSRLVSSQLSRINYSKYLCDGCFTFIRNDEQLLNHQNEECNKIKTILPPKGTKSSFTHLERQLRVNIFNHFFNIC